jgi:hypothetical protein
LDFIGHTTSRILGKVIRSRDVRQDFLREFAWPCAQLEAVFIQDRLQLGFKVIAQDQLADLDIFDDDHGAQLAREHFQHQVAEQLLHRLSVCHGPQHLLHLFEVSQDFIQRGVLDFINQLLLCEPKLHCNSGDRLTYDEDCDVTVGRMMVE